MKTKSLFLPLIVICLLLACSPPKKSAGELEEIRQEVIENDLAFSRFSSKNGFPKALAQYAADDAIKLNPRLYSTFGKAELQKEAAADTIDPGQNSLTWEPRKVHISESGDMAAAFGDWYFKFKSPRTSNDTTVYGNYLTVWKKQSDGAWKFILDGGNPVPGPTSEELLQLVNNP